MSIKYYFFDDFKNFLVGVLVQIFFWKLRLAIYLFSIRFLVFIYFLIFFNFIQKIVVWSLNFSKIISFSGRISKSIKPYRIFVKKISYKQIFQVSIGRPCLDWLSPPWTLSSQIHEICYLDLFETFGPIVEL